MSEKEELQEEIEYVGRIKQQWESLSKSQKRIADYILNHRESVIKYSITTLAQKTNTVPSTITRFCQTLSYKGFSELKVYIEKDLVSPQVSNKAIEKNDTIQVILQKLFNTSQNAFSDTLRTLNARNLVKAADAILTGRKIVFLGQSSGYASCLYAQQQFLRINVIGQAVTGNTDMSLAAGALNKNDVVVGIGYSGEGRSVINAMQIAKDNKATVIAITATPNSTMAKLADISLIYSQDIPDDLKYLHLASVCEIMIIGAISTEILRRPEHQKKIESSRKVLLASRKK